MKVMVVGAGGREHALAWALASSPQTVEVVCVPGNDGMARMPGFADMRGRTRCVAADMNDGAGLAALAERESVSFAVIGPETPLAAGVADALRACGVAVVGPGRKAARLESSKLWMKAFCRRHRIPVAGGEGFDDAAQARRHIAKSTTPLVVKSDGLAAGKGVFVCACRAEAFEAVAFLMERRGLGEAGGSVLIEEYLTGEELSFFALCDGVRAVPLAAARDYKRLCEGNRGPNTGGMGAVSSPGLMSAALCEEVMARVVRPALRGMAAEDAPYRGVLFAGLMLTAEGPKLLEFNVRFGDPECQAILARLQSDAASLLGDAHEGRNPGTPPLWRKEASVSVVLAQRGYPAACRRGVALPAMAELGASLALEEGVFVFHGATRCGRDGLWRSDGGRVLSVTALGRDVAAARRRAYMWARRLAWPEAVFRRDIGLRLAKGG